MNLTQIINMGTANLFSELAENAVIDYGLNAFKLYSGDDIVLSTFMENKKQLMPPRQCYLIIVKLFWIAHIQIFQIL